ncbi:hypothetical protein J6590_087334 [Homalodisca vitripennis]|nr:hypothetical protein J6590_087334 [Homalodisca vitripennis]
MKGKEEKKTNVLYKNSWHFTKGSPITTPVFYAAPFIFEIIETPISYHHRDGLFIVGFVDNRHSQPASRG